MGEGPRGQMLQCSVYRTAKVPRTMPRVPTASMTAKGPSITVRIPRAALPFGMLVTVCSTTEVPSPLLVLDRDGRLKVVKTPVEVPPGAVVVMVIATAGVVVPALVLSVVVVPVLLDEDPDEVVGFVVPEEVVEEPLVVLPVLLPVADVVELRALSQ